LERGRTSPKKFYPEGELRPSLENNNVTQSKTMPVNPFSAAAARLHTVKDAAQRLGMTPPTLRRMIAEGGIKAVVAGSTFRISDAEIQRVMAPMEAN